MPKIKGDPAQYATRGERLEALIQAVGGPTDASRLAGKTRSTIDNWRKRGSAELADLVPLIEESGISLDWLAMGGPDAMAGTATAPRNLGNGKGTAGKEPGRGIEGDLILSADWLDQNFGLTADQVRLIEVADSAMLPMLKRGALVLVDIRPDSVAGDFVVVDGPRLVARRHYVMPDGRAQLTADADPNWRLVGWPDEMPRLFTILWYAQAV
jgi:hypothetical protein